MSARPDLALGPDEVDLWWIALDEVPRDAIAAVIPDEISRAGRFRQVQHRQRWLAARAALRHILASYAGIPPAALRFRPGRWGKPRLLSADNGEESAIRFNLAHAAERALVAVAWEREVGVDLEPIDATLDVAALLPVACTAAEAARLAKVPDDQRAAAFLTLWTGKEAYLKATGRGLSREPRTIGIDRDETGRLAVRDPQASDPLALWQLASLACDEGWIAALAISGPPPVVTGRRFPLSTPDG